MGRTYNFRSNDKKGCLWRTDEDLAKTFTTKKFYQKFRPDQEEVVMSSVMKLSAKGNGVERIQDSSP